MGKKIKLEVTIAQNENGHFFAEIDSVPGVYSWGERFSDIESGINEAFQLHIEGLREDGQLINHLDGEFDFHFKLPVNAALQLLGIENKSLAQSSGIHHTLLSQYRTGIKTAGAKQKQKLNDTIRQLAESLKRIQVI